MKIRRIKTVTPVSVIVFLGSLSLILAYAAFNLGGTAPAEWDRCVVALGLLLLVYFRFTDKSNVAPFLEWWFLWPLVLLIGFIGLQLVPLPPSLLRIVSPTRLRLFESLPSVSPGGLWAPISVFPYGTLAHLLRVTAYVVVFVITRELAWRTRRRRWLMVAPIVIIAAVEGLWGVLQYDPVAGSFAQGTYANRNHFAGLLELALPFAVVYPMMVIGTPRGRSGRPALTASLSIVSATLILLGIVLSTSRMAFVAALTSLFVVGTLGLGTRISPRKRLITPGIVGILVIAGFFYLAPDVLIGRFAEVMAAPNDMTKDARAHLWSDTWHLAADYPLVGCGLGTFEQAFVKYKTFAQQVTVDAVHNDYLQLLAELGRIGLAIAGTAMAAVFLTAARTGGRKVNPMTRFLGIACLGSLIAILIHSYTDFNLYIPANAVVLAWIAGVVASLNFESPAALEIEHNPQTIIPG